MRISSALLLSAFTLGAATANAAVVSLDFEGVNATYPSNDFGQILEFYNGGTSSQGTSGTNFGVSFDSNALAVCLNSATEFCSNASRGGLAPTSAEGALFFLNADVTFLNFAAGFDTGFSFNYSKPNDFAGSVSVYSGLDGSGDLLGSLQLAQTVSDCPGFSSFYCPFVAGAVAFTGTARSIGFAGVANFVAFDDVTFGSVTPGPAVPEPATWAMLVSGFGLIGAVARRRNSGRVTFA